LENAPKINRPVFRQEGKGLAEVSIHDDLVATLGAEAISYPSVTRHLREARLAISNPGITFSNSSLNRMIVTKLSCSLWMNNYPRLSAN
jgi:hypothetical protein